MTRRRGGEASRYRQWVPLTSPSCAWWKVQTMIARRVKGIRGPSEDWTSWYIDICSTYSRAGRALLLDIRPSAWFLRFSSYFVCRFVRQVTALAHPTAGNGILTRVWPSPSEVSWPRQASLSTGGSE